MHITFPRAGRRAGLSARSSCPRMATGRNRCDALSFNSAQSDRRGPVRRLPIVGRDASVGHALRIHPPPSRPGPAPRRDAQRRATRVPAPALFADLQAPSRRAHGRFGAAASLAVHAAVLFALVLLPLLRHEELPAHRDYIRALLYAPPPPPPLPPPRGSPLVREAAAARPDKPPETRPALAMPEELSPQAQPAPEANADDPESWGDPAGSDAGVPEGMEGGVEGGMVGGVPGGVIGGVIGGTGDGDVPPPVTDYDQAPRVIRQIKPVYPQDAFIKKVEGTVVVEILIGADGRVARARVLRSVPYLDAAALACVRQWVFAPGTKRGRPVPTLAQAPITFRIY